MGGVLEVPRKEGGEVPPSLCWYPPPQPLETKKPRYPERWLFHQLRAESQSNWMQGGGGEPPPPRLHTTPPNPKAPNSQEGENRQDGQLPHYKTKRAEPPWPFNPRSKPTEN